MGQLQRMMWKEAGYKKECVIPPDRDVRIDLNNTGLISVRLTDSTYVIKDVI